MLEGVRRFNEEPQEVKREYYSRDCGRKASTCSRRRQPIGGTLPSVGWRRTLQNRRSCPSPAEKLLSGSQMKSRDREIFYLNCYQKHLAFILNHLEEMEMCERTCFSFELLSTMPRASLDSWNKQAVRSGLSHHSFAGSNQWLANP